jgi:superoxide reductase
MTSRGQVWKCDVCGNVVEVLHSGSDSLVCCGKPMRLMNENAVYAAFEKHLPVIEGKKVKIGSVAHPMEEKHYIEWIEATSANGEVAKVFLQPGQKPEAEFEFEPVSAREYCNLHGLWKN